MSGRPTIRLADFLRPNGPKCAILVHFGTHEFPNSAWKKVILTKFSVLNILGPLVQHVPWQLLRVGVHFKYTTCLPLSARALARPARLIPLTPTASCLRSCLAETILTSFFAQVRPVFWLTCLTLSSKTRQDCRTCVLKGHVMDATTCILQTSGFS